MEAKISVIIPFYKTPIVKLRICIESFLNQSFKEFELLLVDDGNGSEYNKICGEYAERDERVRVISQKNAGVSAARNNGIQNAKGEYIVFCDSDDYVDINYLEVMYQNIPGYDMVICGVCEQYYPSNDSTVDMKVFYSTPTQYNWIQYVNFTHNKIFRRSIIHDHGMKFDSSVRLGEDAIFVCQYLKYCKHVRCIKDMLYHYVWDRKSAVHVYNEKYWQWEKRVISCQYEMFHQYPLNRDEEDFMQNWLYIKLRSSLFYYLDNEKNQRKRDSYIKEILNYKYFNCLFDNYQNNQFFKKGTKAVLWAWKLFRDKGVILTYRYDIVRFIVKQ